MKIKLFKIRLSDDHLQSNQDVLNEFLETVSVKKATCQLIDEGSRYWSIVVFYDQKASGEPRPGRSEKIHHPVDTILTESEQKIFEAFKTWRQTKASELNLPSYMICSNSELMTLVKERPDSIEQLIKIRGFGDQKTAKFGDDIIALLNSF